jgi:L-threonylcarbamoyladenylate synthase
VVINQEDTEADELKFQTLRRGGVVIMRCDTIYGIVGIYPETEGRIRRIKERPEGSPFVLLIADARWVRRFSDAPFDASLRKCWPGPFTLIFPRRDGGTVGLRVPEDTSLRTLLRRLDTPLISTSVNRSGDPFLGAIREIAELFDAKVDLIVDGGDAADQLPSTILDLTVSPYRVLRRGAGNPPSAALGSS